MIYFRYPLMVDYPNHLSRLYILAATPLSPFRQMFITNWTLIPNLGLDLTYLALTPVLSPEKVAIGCVVVSLTTILVATYYIQLSLFHRISYTISALPIFIYNITTYMGYISYLMGVALAFVGLAIFIHRNRELTGKNILLLATLGGIVFICHILAFASYVMIIGLLRLYKLFPRSVNFVSIKVTALAAFPVLLIASPGLILYLFSQKPSHTHGIGYSYLTPLRVLLAPTLAGTPLDVVLLIIVIIFLVTIYLVVIRAKKGAVAFWKPGHTACLVLLLLVIALPEQIDDAVDIGRRLITFLLFLPAAMTEFQIFSRPLRLAISVFMIVLIGIRAAAVAEAAAAHDRSIEEFRASDKVVAKGSKVLVARDARTDSNCTELKSNSFEPLYTHIGSFLAIDREAFIPITFAGQGMQPIRFKGKYDAFGVGAQIPVPVELLTLATSDNINDLDAVITELQRDHEKGYFIGWPSVFDFLLIINNGCDTNPLPTRLSERASGGFFAIYQIVSR